MIEGFEVVSAHPRLVEYVDSLQRKNAEAVSFYPKCVFEREQQAGRIILGILNREPCGYLYAGAPGGDVKLHQVCVQYDTRRRLYGAALVGYLETWAMRSQSNSITLRCGFDLDANSFWQALGYQCIGHRMGGVRRMRTINVWRKYLQPALIAPATLDPAVGKTNASIWAAGKSTGEITQFARGKQMNEYRASVIASAKLKEAKA